MGGSSRHAAIGLGLLLPLAALFACSPGRQAGRLERPTNCPAGIVSTPLDDGCHDPVCHAVIRLDYQTLALKGYAVVGGPDKPTSAAAAKALGNAFALQKLGQPPDYTKGTVSKAGMPGLHTVTTSLGDLGGFTTVSALAGVVVAAGSITWAASTSPSFAPWWKPTQWNKANKLGCVDTAAEPTAPTAITEGRCVGFVGDPKYKVSDAVELARWLNLTRAFASKGAFRLYATLYTPAVGMCQPQWAEFLVYLSQRRK